MAELIWTEPALNDLDAIADYIALDKPDAAARLVQRVFAAVEKLQRYPGAGRVPPELPEMMYREVIVAPCRMFYRFDGETLFVLYVQRGEQEFRSEVLIDRDK
jgi:toxin ParE1/3/4